MGIGRWVQGSEIKDTIKILDEQPSSNMGGDFVLCR